MGANAISCSQTQRAPLRMSVQVNCSPFDSVRRWQTPEMGLDFPDTEEVTGSNPVRPTSKDVFSGTSFFAFVRQRCVVTPRPGLGYLVVRIRRKVGPRT
jgi:hypothetical protein